MTIEVELFLPPHKFVVHIADYESGENTLGCLSDILNQWTHDFECFEIQHAVALFSKVLEELQDPTIEIPQAHRFRDLL